MNEVVVFAGPSIPRREISGVGRCHVLPPARQGDVWRAMERKPRVSCLIDGVFEAAPSVWHRELCSALDAGIAVFGGASMGALRAVELGRYGMVGVGQVFRWYRDGVIEDDSEVALVHADAGLGYEAFSVPLVTVRGWAEAAVAAGELTERSAARAVRAAGRVFWQDRSLDRMQREGVPQGLVRWAGVPGADVKRLDARACLKVAVEFAVARQPRSAG